MDVAVAHELVAAAQHTGVAELRTEIVVPQVGVGVEVDDVEVGVFLRHGLHRTQRDQMLAAQQERNLPSCRISAARASMSARALSLEPKQSSRSPLSKMSKSVRSAFW